MRYLYIFPHPDDESFGPAPGISWQRRHGHEVFLLTLTRGEATKRRFDLGLSKAQMGEVRFREMQEMAGALQLSELTVLDLPDSGFKEMDPREIERVVQGQIERIRPDIVVTYPVHGISGFHDHLVIHGVVKRVFLGMRDAGADYLQRLAFFTISTDALQRGDGIFKLHASTDDEIDCRLTVDEADMIAFHRALDAYRTYAQTIEESRVRELVTREVCYEIFQESHQPPLKDLAEGLA